MDNAKIQAVAFALELQRNNGYKLPADELVDYAKIIEQYLLGSTPNEYGERDIVHRSWDDLPRV